MLEVQHPVRKSPARKRLPKKLMSSNRSQKILPQKMRSDSLFKVIHIVLVFFFSAQKTIQILYKYLSSQALSHMI